MHTVGTISYGNHIADATGRIVGIAHPPRDLSGDEAAKKAHANALLWACSPDLLEVCNAVDADIERDGAVSAGTIEAVRAAIKKATVAVKTNAVAALQGAATVTATMMAVGA